MKLSLFIDAVCPTGEHCAFCRNKEGGRSFRANMAKRFIMPNGAPDFECPSGHAWGAAPEKPAPKPAPSRGLGDTIAKITSAVGIKPCGGCARRREKLNRIFPYKAAGE